MKENPDNIGKSLGYISDILSHFYQAFNWGWFTDGGKVPTPKSIRETIYHLLQNVKKDGQSAETGGLRVERVDGCVNVYMVITVPFYDVKLKGDKK